MNIQDFYPYFTQAKKVEIDHRKIESGDIFFAFSGENFNAATRAEKAIEQGALAVIVEDKTYENIEKCIFYTPSTLQFLQQLAIYHRSQIKIPIIGLTGSNGKTTTKELIHAILSKKYLVQYTKGNLNNHIGVPLTLLSIGPEHEIAVIEMGANHQKEIEFLCSISQPTIGYITNFGKAHLEGFGGFEGVIKGKTELYDYLKQNQQKILVNQLDDIQVEKVKSYFNTISFGLPTSKYQFEMSTQNHFIGLKYQHTEAMSQLTGKYNYTNLCAAVSLGLHFEVEFSLIAKAIREYTPTNMRSQIVEKQKHTLVLDTYNANPSSMTESLRNFSTFEGSKTIIIGDMLELGEESAKEHLAMFELAKSLDFDEIITVGKLFQQCNNHLAFEKSEELGKYIIENPISNKNILLKGSRGIALEKILEFL